MGVGLFSLGISFNAHAADLPTKATIKNIPSAVSVVVGDTYHIKADVKGKIPTNALKVESTNKTKFVVKSVTQKNGKLYIDVQAKRVGNAKVSVKAYENKKCTVSKTVTVNVKEPTAEQREKAGYQLLRANGFSHTGACAVLGNLQYESNLNPNNAYKSYYGMMMLKGERLQNMKSWCGKNGYSYKSFSGQMAFLVHEMPSRMKTQGYNAVKKANASAVAFRNATTEFAVGYNGAITTSAVRKRGDAPYTGKIYKNAKGKYVTGLYTRISKAETLYRKFK